jgi:DNA-binding LacI/PurR family transcriptional regulator
VSFILNVTLQQIADRSGVSVSTVSAALSPVCKKQISKKRISEIKTLAEKMGYQPNLSARRLRTGKTYNVGVVINSYLEHHPISKYFDLVSAQCIRRGYHAMPLVVGRNYDDISKQLELLSQHHVDGLLFLDYVRQAYGQYLKLWQSNRAMVFRIPDQSMSNVPFNNVLIDHYTAGKNLIRHVSKNWSDLYFVLENINDNSWNMVWEKGFYRSWVDYVNENQLELTRNCIFYSCRTGQSRYEAIKKFISSGNIQKGETALILDGGDGASSVYAALAEAGLAVGRDVAVASMHSMPANEFVLPGMTVLSEPYELIAKELVERLLMIIEDKQKKFNLLTTYEPMLIESLSTCRKS